MGPAARGGQGAVVRGGAEVQDGSPPVEAARGRAATPDERRTLDRLSSLATAVVAGFTTANGARTTREGDLAALYPRERWMAVTHALIFHGRRVCLAVKPACASCAASAVCPSAFDAVHIGRKTS